MEMAPVKPERKAQLETYAKEHGQSPAEALDALLAAQLEGRNRFGLARRLARKDRDAFGVTGALPACP
jgi:hypothetical protein